MHIVNLEEIQGLLLVVPELIQRLENHDPNFVSSVKDWLTRTEQILVNNRLAAAGSIAALRGVLISAERGVVPSEIVFSGRKNPRKIKDAVAADILRKAEEQISASIRVYAAQVAEGEKLARQLAALATRKGLIPEKPYTGNHTDILNAIWRRMSEDPELGPATIHLAGLVGAYDALILIDRMIT